MTASKTFCILPWTSLATNASGNLRVCCNVIPGKGFICKPNKLEDKQDEATRTKLCKTRQRLDLTFSGITSY